MDRREYIGSSDARDIMTGNWIPLWMIKTGRADAPNLDDNFQVQLGKFTEQFHINWSVAELMNDGWVEESNSQQAEFGYRFFEHKMPIVSHVDAVVSRMDKGKAVFEAKHTHTGWTMADIANYYMPQVQHHLQCTGYDLCCLSVIRGNASPERMWIGRSNEWLEIYEEKLRTFLGYIERDERPPLAETMDLDVVVPTAVRDAIPIDGKVKRDMAESNSFCNAAATYIECEQAAKDFEQAKKDIKAAFADNDGELYAKVAIANGTNEALIRARKDKRGAVRISVEEPA